MDDNTIDLGSIVLDLGNSSDYFYPADAIYTSSSSDTITLSGSYMDSSSTTISLDSTSLGVDISGWYEDQQIIDEYKEEKALREQNEGIQHAWEQYKILVELAKNPPKNLD